MTVAGAQEYDAEAKYIKASNKVARDGRADRREDIMTHRRKPRCL